MTNEPVRRTRNRRSKLWTWLKANAAHEGDECLIWPFGRTPAGYGHLRYRNHQMSAHRAMCEMAWGSPPFPKAHAAHSCGKGHDGCINPQHLRWATAKANCADKSLHGTAQTGANNPAAKLTEDQVLAICADRRRNSVVAKDFGLSSAAVRAIRCGQNWAASTKAVARKAEGNLCRGEDHPQVKFSAEQVVAILKDPRSERAIAADFGCSRSLVNSIKTGRVWGHVTGQSRREYPFEAAA